MHDRSIATATHPPTHPLLLALSLDRFLALSLDRFLARSFPCCSQALGDCLGLALPVASAANEQFKRARTEHGDEDFAAVFAASKK